jgi:hypothetical protein
VEIRTCIHLGDAHDIMGLPLSPPSIRTLKVELMEEAWLNLYKKRQARKQTVPNYQSRITVEPASSRKQLLSSYPKKDRGEKILGFRIQSWIQTLVLRLKARGKNNC